MSRKKVWLVLIGILILAAGMVFLASPTGPTKLPYQWLKELKLKLGLDLQGGSQLIYEADLTQIKSGEEAEAINGARDVIERRVNAFGVSEPLVQVQGDRRIVVELPGVTDLNRAVDEIGKTPFLEFKEPNPDIDPNNQQITPDQAFVSTGLNGAQFERADVNFDQGGQPSILLNFNDEGKKLFAEITKRNVGKPVAIYLDGELLSAPTVQQEITAGQATITGDFTIEEAKDLKQNLNAGALPVPINLVGQANVGASLGQESIEKSLFAGVVGILGVIIFMLAYYRIQGFVAAFALLLYSAIIIVVYKFFGITLTLAGLAGFFLSIGIAVDANVLIFERVREALREGLDPIAAVEDGFKHAWTSIRDSNLSSLISVVIMYTFTTSIVRGFALTLGIGVLVSMFSAINVSRTLLRWLVGFRWAQRPWLLGIRKSEIPKTEESTP